MIRAICSDKDLALTRQPFNLFNLQTKKNICCVPPPPPLPTTQQIKFLLKLAPSAHVRGIDSSLSAFRWEI